MVWINWSGGRHDNSSFVFSGPDSDPFFGRKQYSSGEAAVKEWRSRGYASNPTVRWEPLPGESPTPPPEQAASLAAAQSQLSRDDAAAKRGFSGNFSDQGLKVVTTPTGSVMPGSQAEAKKEMLESDTAQWESPESYTGAAEQFEATTGREDVHAAVPTDTQGNVQFYSIEGAPGYQTSKEAAEARLTAINAAAVAKTAESAGVQPSPDYTDWQQPTELNPETGKPWTAPDIKEPSIITDTRYENYVSAGLIKGTERLGGKYRDWVAGWYGEPGSTIGKVGKGIIESPAVIVESGGQIAGGAEFIVREPKKALGGIPSGFATQYEGIKENPAEFAGTLIGTALLSKGVGKVRGVKAQDVDVQPGKSFTDPMARPEPVRGKGMAPKKSQPIIEKQTSPEILSEVQLSPKSAQLTMGDAPKYTQAMRQARSAPSITGAGIVSASQPKNTPTTSPDTDKIVLSKPKKRIYTIEDVTKTPFSSSPIMPGQQLLKQSGGLGARPKMPAERLAEEFLPPSRRETFLIASKKETFLTGKTIPQKSRGKGFTELKSKWEGREKKNIEEVTKGNAQRTKSGQIVIQKQEVKEIQKPIQKQVEKSITIQDTAVKTKQKQRQRTATVQKEKQATKQRLQQLTYISPAERMITGGAAVGKDITANLSKSIQKEATVTTHIQRTGLRERTAMSERTGLKELEKAMERTATVPKEAQRTKTAEKERTITKQIARTSTIQTPKIKTPAPKKGITGGSGGKVGKKYREYSNPVIDPLQGINTKITKSKGRKRSK